MPPNVTFAPFEKTKRRPSCDPLFQLSTAHCPTLWPISISAPSVNSRSVSGAPK